MHAPGGPDHGGVDPRTQPPRAPHRAVPLITRGGLRPPVTTLRHTTDRNSHAVDNLWTTARPVDNSPAHAPRNPAAVTPRR
ncbi:hypothetical protein JCM33774_69970 [Actinophytocola sp. KF-1]